MALQDDTQNTWDKIKGEALTDPAQPPTDDQSEMEMPETLTDDAAFREHIGSEDIAADGDANTSPYEAGDEAFLDRDSQ